MFDKPRHLGTVLVVDDNPHNLGVVSECLDAANFEVLIAKSGASALDKVTYVLPDIILLDVMMPGIDGFETCKRLKKERATTNIPIIFMTALADTESKVKAFHLGAADYVTKPFQEDEIIARVKTHLKLHKAIQNIQTTNKILSDKVYEQAVIEDQLRATLTELKTTQSKLIQSEKLSGLGKMIGGIAHEMNNPLTFIEGNLPPLTQYMNELSQAFKIYQDLNFTLPQQSQEKLNTIDLEFILQDIPSVLRSIEVGTTRLAGIVKGLQDFAHLDQSTKKTINIHEALDHTLFMLNYRLQAFASRTAINLHKNYQFKPNTIECYPKLLNQTFFQLLTNAIDAIDEKAEVAQDMTMPEITITTQQQNNCLQVNISDNGIGISPKNYPHIFDPFFTTKQAGHGIGLGLSNVHQTIERHQGTIHCQSTLHQGTTFEIILPLNR